MKTRTKRSLAWCKCFFLSLDMCFYGTSCLIAILVLAIPFTIAGYCGLDVPMLVYRFKNGTKAKIQEKSDASLRADKAYARAVCEDVVAKLAAMEAHHDKKFTLIAYHEG